MAPLTSNYPPRRYERGGVSWVTAMMIAAATAAVYLVVVWAPIWIVHYEVKQTVRDYMNQAIKNREDEALVKGMCDKLQSLHTVTVVAPDGRTERVAAVVVDPADVTWERDTASSPPILRVSFEYTREVHYPYLEKVTEWVGTVSLVNDLTIPNWGPAR